MSFAAVLVYAVTALVAVTVALTYLKPHLLQPQEAGLPPKIHLYAGAAGLLVWVLFLVSPPSFFLGGDVPGVIGLFGIWLAAIAGLYLLARRLKEQRAGAVEDDYGYGDYDEEYVAEDGYDYDEPGYADPGHDGHDGYAAYDDRAGYEDPRRSAQQPVPLSAQQPGGRSAAQPVPQPVAQPGRRAERQPEPRPEPRREPRPEPRRAASGVDETAVMAPIEREPAPAPPRDGQIGRRVAGRPTPPPPAPQQPSAPQPSAPQPPPAPQRSTRRPPVPQQPAPAAPERPRQERPASPEQPLRERPAPQRPAPQRQTPPPPAPEQPQPDQGAPNRRQGGQDPWGRRQEPPQRRSRGYDGRYDDRRNDGHDEFADRRYRRDSSYSGHPGQPQPTPPQPTPPRPAPGPAPRAEPEPAQAPAPPSRPSGRRAAQEPEAYDPYSLDSYGPRGRTESPAQPPRAPQPQPRRQQVHQDYDEPAYPGYDQGYEQGYEQDHNQAYAQGYDYGDAYDRGYDERHDDRYDDAYDRPVGSDRRERLGAFFEASGASIVVHLTLVILAIWLTWAYGTSVI